jgi:WbqC-like protein family
MIKRKLLIESHFLPSIEYFCLLSAYDDIQLEAHEHFVKQSFRNRCYILTVHGPGRLTIPLTAKRGKVLITSVQIDYSVRWQANVWRTIQSAYANSPFFEHYSDELHSVLFSGERNLFQLNFNILSLCLSWLGWTKTLSVSHAYEPEPGRDDLRDVISSKQSFTTRTFLLPFAYRQVFGNTFVANLSLLDLLCCVGPDAGSVLARSAGGVEPMEYHSR